MPTSWGKLKDKTMTARAQRKARRLANNALTKIEMSQLRETLKVTQSQLANKLKVTQTAVSRLESRPDMHLSTLRNYIQALGGEVEILAVFGNRTVRLTHTASREAIAAGRKAKSGDRT
jgi:DNA-binding transcriptional regulator YiaG